MRDAARKDLRFWKADDPYQAVFSLASRLAQYNNARRGQALYYACLYDDAELAAMVQGADAIENSVPQTMTVNVVRRQVDTYTAKITKNRPLPMALTTGGNATQRRRAEAITKFGEGVLDQVNFWATRELRIRDGAVFGSGLARNYRLGQKLFHTRSMPGEIMVDPRDAYYGKPRTILVRHHIDRMVLIEQYPEFEEEILGAASRIADDDLWLTWDDETSDVVVVLEAIHLPSADTDDSDAKSDGAYVKCISNATLENKEYRRGYHPISKNDFQKPLVGYWGEGMVRQLAGLQYEINSVGLRMQENGFMTGSYVWAQEGSGVNVDTLDNSTLSVIRSLTKPEFFTPAPWHPQFMEYYESLLSKRPQDITGLSGFSTHAEIPPGLAGGSGLAIRNYKDTDTENLIPQGREDERDVVDTMWQLFDLMEEIHEESKTSKGKKYKVRVEKRADGRSALQDMDYAAVRMDRDEFTLRTFPTSYLASTPSDRWQQVSEMAEKGLFSEDEVLTLLDFPDVKEVLNLRNSPRRVVERIVEKLLDPDFDGTIVPESPMNLDICVAIGTLAYLEAKWIDGVGEDETTRLLEFVLAARRLRDTGSADGAGPQAGDQDPGALPGEAAPMGGPVNQPGMLPPDAAPPPPGALAPTVMPTPGVQ